MKLGKMHAAVLCKVPAATLSFVSEDQAWPLLLLEDQRNNKIRGSHTMPGFRTNK